MFTELCEQSVVVSHVGLLVGVVLVELCEVIALALQRNLVCRCSFKRCAEIPDVGYAL